MSNKENSSEEIDLGQLFKLIGDMFNRLFAFIGSIFRNAFHFLILFLLFIRRHFIKFAIAGIIGFIGGWFLDAQEEPIYRSSMVVEPNFRSAQQLYNNIEFYNELAEQEAFQTLSNALKISDGEAKTIKSIEIEAFTDENQKLKQFSDFIATIDSTSRANLSYEEYLRNFNNINARFHKIELDATNPEVAKKCQKTIVKSIANNSYFQTQKNTQELNLKINDSVTRKQLAEIDSLKVFYQRLKLLEIEKNQQSSETTINMSSDNQSLDRSEIVLLNESKDLSEQIINLNQQKADKENIINVLSDFPEKGALVRDLITQKKFLLPILLVALTFLIMMGVSLNRFLIHYNRKI